MPPRPPPAWAACAAGTSGVGGSCASSNAGAGIASRNTKPIRFIRSPYHRECRLCYRIRMPDDSGASGRPRAGDSTAEAPFDKTLGRRPSAISLLTPLRVRRIIVLGNREHTAMSKPSDLVQGTLDFLLLKI